MSTPAGGAGRPSVKIKVCGVINPGDAASCCAAGADWIGLNFHPGSPRRIDPDLAASLVAALPAGASAVGLFVDRPAAEVIEVAARVGLRLVQLHGDEPVADLAALGRAGLRVVRAFRLADAASIAAMLAYLRSADDAGHPPYAVLVDAFAPGLAGGTGRAIDPALLAALPPLPRLILAGGLTPGNVADLVRRVRPWMVDVASGVESSPGVKDAGLMAAFVRAARSGLAPLASAGHPDV